MSVQKDLEKNFETNPEDYLDWSPIFKGKTESNFYLDVKRVHYRAQSEFQIQEERALKKKLTVKGSYENYPFKPGFEFYQGLISTPYCSLSELKINIPLSLYCTDTLHLISTSDSGKVEHTNEANLYDFSKKIWSLKAENPASILEEIVVIARAPENKVEDMKKLAMNWNTFRAKIIGKKKTSKCLIEEFIKPANNRPSVVRLFYNPFVKNNKQNYAYFINSLALENASEKRALHCVVDLNSQYLECFKMSGAAILPYEKEAWKLVTFLNKGYNIRIESIVFDFLKDKEGKVWFCGCKSFKIDPATLKEKTRHSPKKSLNIAQCSSCRLSYSLNKLCHTVTLRMIVVFSQHIQRRKPLEWLGNTENYTPEMLSQTLRICKYCYQLITNELELIQYEKKLARFLGTDTFSSTTLDCILPEDLVQWRALIYGLRVFDYEKEPKVFTLSYQFGSTTTNFKINTNTEKIGKTSSIPLNALRIQYIFQDPETPFRPFLKNFNLEISLTYENLIVVGCVAPFQNMSETLPEGEAIYETKLLNLFTTTGEFVCRLSLIVGLSHDWTLESSQIESPIEKVEQTYLAKGVEISPDPLPLTWLEIFSSPCLHIMKDPKMTKSERQTPSFPREELQIVPTNLKENFKHKVKLSLANLRPSGSSSTSRRRSNESTRSSRSARRSRMHR